MPASVYFELEQDVSPLPDHILVYNMEKGERITKGGIILRDDNGKDEGIRPRWCQVYKAGANIDYVRNGEWILVEHGRWTYGVKVRPKGAEGEEVYLQRVDVDAILGVSETKPEGI